MIQTPWMRMATMDTSKQGQEEADQIEQAVKHETLLNKFESLKQPSWKLVVQMAWIPYVALVLLIAWLIAVSQGITTSVPRKNAEELQKIENLLNERTARFERIEKEVKELRKEVQTQKALHN